MEKKEDLEKIVKQLIIRSEDKLDSAQILLKEEKYDDSISRAYYAAFLAVRGLLLLLGDSPRSHSGLITMFGLKVIKQGLLSREIGKALNELFEARQTSDYSIFVYYSKDDCLKYIENSRKITDEIKTIMAVKFGIE